MRGDSGMLIFSNQDKNELYTSKNECGDVFSVWV